MQIKELLPDQSHDKTGADELADRSQGEQSLGCDALGRSSGVSANMA
jgi:hypothetical protein